MPFFRTGWELIKHQFTKAKDASYDGLSTFSPSNIKRKMKEIKQLPPNELLFGFIKLMFLIVYYNGFAVVWMIKKFWTTLMGLMQGPPQEKVHLSISSKMEN